MNKTTWRCSKCKGVWFKKEEYFKLDGNHYPEIEGQDIRPYDAPGSKGYHKAYVCINCGKELKEAYKYAR